MGACLVGLGALMGAAVGGPRAAGAGALVALLLWLLLLAIALFQGERVVLLSTQARRISKEDAPRLWNVVEEMTIAAGLARMPALYIVDEDQPNAFATGRHPGSACIAVTSGLLRHLTRDELQGVIAHEMGHVKNLDIRFMTIALVMVGTIGLLSDMLLRFLWFGGGRRRGARGGGQSQVILVVLALAAAILAPLFARILYFACSRRREYLADASGARFSRYPPGLASALEKISAHLGQARRTEWRSLAPMYIVNPLQAAGGSTGIFSSHPPVEQRIRILRAMAGQAGWADYEKAYRKVLGGSGCVPPRILDTEKSVAARAPTPESQPRQQARQRAREVADLLDRMANFLLITCLCGVRIKVPAAFPHDTIPCTRCGREQPVPRAEPAGETPGASRQSTLHYRRQGATWESFRCVCGRVHQISPAFAASRLRCKGCQRIIQVGKAS
ncbi:MAG: M48 family metallopeptidase [Acidobacteriota bacterium]